MSSQSPTQQATNDQAQYREQRQQENEDDSDRDRRRRWIECTKSMRARRCEGIHNGVDQPREDQWKRRQAAVQQPPRHTVRTRAMPEENPTRVRRNRKESDQQEDGANLPQFQIGAIFARARILRQIRCADRDNRDGGNRDEV